MPKGVYPRTEEQREILVRRAALAAAASAEYWRGRPRSQEQKTAHSERMRGRSAPNRGKPMPTAQREAMVEHGHAAGGISPTYVSWRSMHQRCYYPRKSNFVYYGGRGITVCERWKDFKSFLADMGERPDGTQLSRIDNDGNYEPGNVRWASRAENVAERNRRIAAQR
jgi:hypothetical protein